MRFLLNDHGVAHVFNHVRFTWVHDVHAGGICLPAAFAAAVVAGEVAISKTAAVKVVVVEVVALARLPVDHQVVVHRPPA